MFQNIKVDIIYHKSNTDFEMEFNLCGCCRMRLLTAKTPDKKTLVHSLARAVSRSRVIMIVGELFGEGSVVDIVAAATGSKTEIADNKKYGIDSNVDIKIISGSVPLVTSEGYFGGCIIEKGPQTMILLSDNKNVRKSIMHSLIHPYIEELCALDLKDKAPFVLEPQEANNPIETEEIKEVEETETQETSENVETVEEEAPLEEIEETEEPLEDEFVLEDEAADVVENVVDDGDIEGLIIGDEEEEAEGYYDDEMELVIEDDYEEIEMESVESEMIAEDSGTEVESDLVYEDTTIDFKTFKKRNADYYNEDGSLEGLLTDSDEDSYYKKGDAKGASSVLLWTVAIIVLALFLLVCYTVLVVPASDGVSPVAYIKDIYNTLFG